MYTDELALCRRLQEPDTGADQSLWESLSDLTSNLGNSTPQFPVQLVVRSKRMLNLVGPAAEGLEEDEEDEEEVDESTDAAALLAGAAAGGRYCT